MKARGGEGGTGARGGSAPSGEAGIAGITGGSAGAASGGTTATSGSGGSGGSAGRAGGGQILDSVERPLGCSADGWCWSNPFPIGSDLSALWVTAEDDVWAAGERGAIIHFDGEEWSQAAQATSYDFRALWASGPDDVWAVGGLSAIVHYDGEIWRDYSVREIVSFSAVWGSASDDVWAAGLSGALYHFDGSAWLRVDLGADVHFRSVWGSASDDVWLGAEDGFRRYDGVRWSGVVSPVGEGGRTILGTAPDDVWSVTSTTVLHFDGTEWTDLEVPVNRVQTLHGIWIDAAGVVWTTASFPGQESSLFRYENAAWTELPLGLDDIGFSNMVGSPNGSVWIVGPRGMVLNYDGQTPALLTTDVETELAFNPVLDFGPDDVWASGGGKLYHDTGAGWIEQPLRTNLSSAGYLWAPTRNDIWSFSADGNVDRFNRTTWTNELRSLDAPFQAPTAIWGSVDDLYVVGRHSGRRANGVWEPLLPGGSFSGVWGTAPDDVWLVGADRCWAHWDGSAWERLCTGNSDDVNYRSVWGAASNDVWLVGTRGNIYHNDGSGWTNASSGTVKDLNRIWGSSADDLWVVGVEGLILHGDGGTWTAQESGTRRTLTTVVGTSSGALWATGDDGVILQRTRSFRH